MFGYAIKYLGTYGMIFTASDGEFESYDEARDAMDEHWQEIEENWRGCEPIDYEIYEG